MRLLEALTVGLICGLVVSLIVNVFVLKENQELRRLSTAISPPISKSDAIRTSLEYGRWDETTLKDMVADATLSYSKFYNSTGGWGYEPLYDITEHVSDYSPLHIGVVTYRYVWVVVVRQTGRFRTIPPPGLYYVDAATGEVIPHPLYSTIW
jgi:hypothetical protein